MLVCWFTKLSLDKSAGSDDIPPRLLQATSDTISDPLCLLFRKSLNEGSLPEEWRTANVTPIYKKGDRHVLRNYRPVSLTCQFSKVLESVICDAITVHLERFSPDSRLPAWVPTWSLMSFKTCWFSWIKLLEWLMKGTVWTFSTWI